MNALAERLPPFMRRMDPAVVTAFACILLLLFLGSLYSSNFLSPEYLLQQLKVASFLGIIATAHDAGHSSGPDRSFAALGGDVLAP